MNARAMASGRLRLRRMFRLHSLKQPVPQRLNATVEFGYIQVVMLRTQTLTDGFRDLPRLEDSPIGRLGFVIAAMNLAAPPPFFDQLDGQKRAGGRQDSSPL